MVLSGTAHDQRTTKNRKQNPAGSRRTRKPIASEAALLPVCYVCVGRAIVGKKFFVFYFGRNVFYHVTMVPNAFLFLEGAGCIFINVVGTCNCRPRQSTPPGIALARDALRGSGREGTIVARGGLPDSKRRRSCRRSRSQSRRHRGALSSAYL